MQYRRAKGLSAGKGTFVPIIKDCKFDTWMMPISNSSCQKAMKGNFCKRITLKETLGKKLQPRF